MGGYEGKPVVVILAGGTGTRFWPLSTKRLPKQFLPFLGSKSLLELSYERARGLTSPEKTFVFTNKAFAKKVREKLKGLPPENVIAEPLKKDTSAPVILSAFLTGLLFGEEVIVTLTADHYIDPLDRFLEVAKGAIQGAKRTMGLYTFGIKPTYPATSYGYLELGQRIPTDDGLEHYKVLRFKEKPDRETAERWLLEGRYLWNSGMFVWQKQAILEEASKFLPQHVEAFERVLPYFGTKGWQKALKEAFEKIPSISIDYGVMERSERVFCVLSDFKWSDLGGWLSLGEFLPKDQVGNAYRGVLKAIDASENIVFCQNLKEEVYLIGIKDLVVVRHGRRTLLVHKAAVERIKELVRSLGEDL